MATKLKNLKVRKVDFVDEGANPDADIKMKKRKENESEAERFASAGGGASGTAGSSPRKQKQMIATLQKSEGACGACRGFILQI